MIFGEILTVILTTFLSQGGPWVVTAVRNNQWNNQFNAVRPWSANVSREKECNIYYILILILASIVADQYCQENDY